MLGNLFTQKRDAATQQPHVAPVPVQPQDPNAMQPAAVEPVPAQPAPVAPQQPNVIGTQMDPKFRQDMSALSHLDVRATRVLAAAQKETMRIKQAQIEPEQVLLGLLYDEEIFKLLEQFSVDAAKLSQEIQGKEQMGTAVGQPTLSDVTKQIFEQAYKSAKDRSSTFITPEDILLVLFSGTTGSVLQQEGLTKENLEEKLSKNVEFSTGKKSVIEKFSTDLTAEAKAGKLDPVFGRDKEVERLTHILLRRTKNNPIIIGEAGVGKTALIEGLAQKIVSGEAPKDLLNKRILQLDVSSLVAGASHRGEFEERLRSVMKEAIASSGQIILFVDEIHTLIGAGGDGGAMDASNIIKPHLARGQLQIIGTTTTSEYRKYFEKDKAFERRFQPIVCEEPEEEAAIAMLQIIKPKYEKFHAVTFPDETLAAAVKLSKKYIGQRFLPDKAVDLLDEAAAEVKLMFTQNKRQDSVVSRSDIEKVVSSWTGIPITKLTEDESKKLLELDKLIHQRFIDQEEAVKGVAEAVRRGRIGLASANRPIASFIFLGPTGVGKTELAKTLAEILFGRDDAMVRLDMSEYMEKHEVAKLIGAPPGYVGYEEGGQLTEAVRRKPYSIVLLDEVEKAHPDVFNILLQLLEDGRLTDNKGNTVSFKNTIIIATSNIGSSLIQQALLEKKPNEDDAKKFADLKTMLTGELTKFFRPELLNRFDEVIVFKPLRQEDMAFIAKLGIKKTGNLLKEQGFLLDITDKALAQLAKEGYDPMYGARPLRRLIQTAIENPIALELISKRFVAGDTILIDFDEQKNAYTFVKPAPPATDQAGNPLPSTPTPAPVTPAQPQAVEQPVILEPVAQPPVPVQPEVTPTDGTQLQKQDTTI